MDASQQEIETLRQEADRAYSDFTKKIAEISARRVRIMGAAHATNDAKKIGIIQRLISKLTS